MRAELEVTVSEALKIVLDAVGPVRTSRAEIPYCVGSVLAEPIKARWDVPPLDNSAMDGFAVRSCDLANATPENPGTLDVIESLPAGRMAAKAVRDGSAIRIMTGAPIPGGADAVVPIEDVVVDGNRIVISHTVQPRTHIRLAGEDVKSGDEVLLPGTVLSPAAVGMLASLGCKTVLVHRQPQVSVLSTGDELVDVDGDRSGGRIIASNTYSLSAQILQCGARPIIAEIAGDTATSIEERIAEIRGADVMVTSGGVSMGDYDLVIPVLESLGCKILFNSVKMRPGHPTTFGVLDGKPVFALPGNPVSCMVAFEQFVRPVLLRMMGHTEIHRPTVRARLTHNLRQKPGRLSFIRALVTATPDGLLVSATGSQSSGVLTSMVRANGLLLFPRDMSEMPVGHEAEVQIIDSGFWQVYAAARYGFTGADAATLQASAAATLSGKP